MTSYNDKEMKDIFIYQDDQKQTCIKKSKPKIVMFYLLVLVFSFWGTCSPPSGVRSYCCKVEVTGYLGWVQVCCWSTPSSEPLMKTKWYLISITKYIYQKFHFSQSMVHSIWFSYDNEIIVEKFINVQIYLK